MKRIRGGGSLLNASGHSGWKSSEPSCSGLPRDGVTRTILKHVNSLTHLQGPSTLRDKQPARERERPYPARFIRPSMKFQHFNAPTNREIYNQWTHFHARLPRIFVVGSSRVLRVSSTPHRESRLEKEKQGWKRPSPKDDRVYPRRARVSARADLNIPDSPDPGARWPKPFATNTHVSNGVDKRKRSLTSGSHVA